MRYYNVNDITFTDKAGDSHIVKDIRNISIFETLVEIDLLKGSQIDEIMSRKTLYGDNNEDLSYTAFDHNIIDIYEAEFDLTKLKKIKIPIVEEIF